METTTPDAFPFLRTIQKTLYESSKPKEKDCRNDAPVRAVAQKQRRGECILKSAEIVHRTSINVTAGDETTGVNISSSSVHEAKKWVSAQMEKASKNRSSKDIAP